MEENKSIFSYITQLFATYGLIVVIFMIFGSVIGDLASEHSTLFSMKNAGFSISTLAQLFLLALVITVTQIVFLTDKWIKSLCKRNCKKSVSVNGKICRIVRYLKASG